MIECIVTKGKINECVLPKCHENVLTTRIENVGTKRFVIQTCTKCGTRYVPEALTVSYPDCFRIIKEISEKEILSIKKKNREIKSPVQLPIPNEKGMFYYCPHDKTLLSGSALKKGKNKEGEIFWVRFFTCPNCKRQYTGIDRFVHMTEITIHGKKYINLKPQKLPKSKKKEIKEINKANNDSYMVVQPPVRCILYSGNRPSVCKKVDCGSGLITQHIRICGYDAKSMELKSPWCKNCNAFHVSIGAYNLNKELFSPINITDIPVLIEEWNLRKEKKKEVRKKRKLERTVKSQEQLEWDELAKRLAQEKEIEKQTRQKEYEETRNRFRERERERQLLDASKRPLKLYQHDNIIRPKDFVVWRSTFKCVHNNHELEDVVASVEVIDNKGNVIPVKIPAGYCGTCNLFIIMDSVYQDLKKRGTPICRVTDEAGCYGGYESANGMLLADESLLMQYGYTVNQAEGLSSARRQKILSVIMDNGIMTKSEIISYLDFFVIQRKSRPIYEKAIEKWEEDREFVEEYKIGSYTQYKIGSISRKH